MGIGSKQIQMMIGHLSLLVMGNRKPVLHVEVCEVRSTRIVGKAHLTISSDGGGTSISVALLTATVVCSLHSKKFMNEINFKCTGRRTRARGAAKTTERRSCCCCCEILICRTVCQAL